MIMIAVLAGSGVLLLLALIHFYWAAGGKWGAKGVLPVREGETEPLFQPRPAGTTAVAVILFAISIMLLAQGGLMPGFGPNVVTSWSCTICAAAFLLRAIGDFRYLGFFKRVKSTRFSAMDTKLYSPLCLLLAVLLYLASL
ncbi:MULTISPECIES: DUF3995 domain-containing protein [unclassified Paenibacillus]|uniref:DUF3995 domain-containing protein n=1 Tax=unclassified Paenibacillus TaxID=185978 RepID=UPI00362ED3CB